MAKQPWRTIWPGRIIQHAQDQPKFGREVEVATHQFFFLGSKFPALPLAFRGEFERLE
jgi:hypothetical protein